ncbi:MAG: ribosome biogenesis GTP-binding protein YihA/YsxC [Eubacteriales bacterium]|nr:ribosome biogenesis GTP-binding protein YihA/YsxC [Eubacteriales bacterium]
MSKAQADSIFQKAKFSRLVARLEDLPSDGLPQVLAAGKSNVGKSSLINRLCRQKRLARTAQQAGKTKNLVFFDLAGEFYLVDLPGYGFSKSSKAEQQRFSRLTDAYLHSASPIHLILHILDARHLPTQQDLAMLSWLEGLEAPYVILLNKSDKLSRNQQVTMRQKIHQYLQEKTGIDFYLLSVSAETGQGIGDLEELILQSVGLT